MTVPVLSVLGKVALVTGAGRGIGRAIALGLAEAGADVAVASRSLPQLEEVAKEIRALGRRALPVPADTSNKTQVEAMIARAESELGPIDILINNAGIVVPDKVMDISEADWDRLMDTNVKGYLLCSQAAGRLMRQRQRGAIVNMASIGAWRVLRTMPVYSVSKASVAMLTKTLAVELAPHVRVNALAPGMVKTDINRFIWEDPAALKIRVKASPMGRVTEFEDLVGAVLFLVSDASAYITGHVLPIDGGTTLY